MTSSTSRAVATTAIDMGNRARVSVGWGDRGGGRGHRGTRAARAGWKQRRRRKGRERRGERFWWGFWATCGETAEKRESEGHGEVGFFFLDGKVGLLSR